MNFDGKCYICKSDIMIFDFNHNPISRNINYTSIYVVLQKDILDENEEVADTKTSRMKLPVCKACALTVDADLIFNMAISKDEAVVLNYQQNGFLPKYIEEAK